MGRAVVAVALAAMLSGCVSYRASKFTAIAGAAVVIAGLVLTATVLADTSDPNRGLGAIVIGAVVIAPGALIGLGGLIGMAAHGDPDEKPAEPPPPEPEMRVDPECKQQRSARLTRAQAIADPDQRAKALVAIPMCEPVPVQPPPP